MKKKQDPSLLMKLYAIFINAITTIGELIVILSGTIQCT